MHWRRGDGDCAGQKEKGKVERCATPLRLFDRKQEAFSAVSQSVKRVERGLKVRLRTNLPSRFHLVLAFSFSLYNYVQSKKEI